MMLKNMVEDKQLDFNRPFRSVRTRPIAPRVVPGCNDSTKTDNSIPRIPTLPSYKPEMKSGPIRNPGTVPFQWEKSPGRPKNESKSQTRPPVAPKLPPGRIMNAQQQSSDKGSVDLENVAKRDSAKQETKDEEGFESEDDDSEAYVDARDTLSRTESSLLNCSVSGLSGFDGPYVKPFGAFSDPQARDFMMGRFLPAAKAMASESPHYSARKQPVARELPPRRVNMTATVDKQRDCARGVEAEESEDDSESDDEPEYPTSKACGLIPQFCLLSPVPGLRAQARPVKKPDGSALYKRLQGRALPSSPNDPSARSHKNLRQMLACKSNDWESGSPITPVAKEKTLYIDSVHFPKPSDSRNDLEVLEKETEKEAHFPKPSESRNDLEVLEKEMEKEEARLADYSDDLRQGQDLVQVSKTSEDARNNTKELSLSYLPLPPPLPKSPSESWLSRALTTAASSRNHRPSPDTYSYNRTHASKTTSPLDPKWETIVKTSNTHNERLRFSEELLAPIPEA